MMRTLQNQPLFSKAADDVRGFIGARPTHPLSPAELQDAADAYYLRGGKLVRPALCCLTAHALSGGESDAWRRAVVCGAATEMFHLSTLVHDDVIDRDATRRGGKSAHVLASGFSAHKDPEKALHYGVSAAILAGDALLGRAFYYLSQAPVCDRAHRFLAEKLSNDVMPQLLTGECLDTKLSDPSEGFDDALLETIYHTKTGVLFEFAMTCGAVCAFDKAPARALQAGLADLSRSMGLLFQLTDDHLGLCAEETSLGKPLYSDLREGKRTFFLLWAYEKADAGERAFLDRTLGNPAAAPEDLKQARDLFLQYGKEPYQARIRELETCAERQLALFPDGEAKTALHALISFFSQRDH